MWEGIQLGLATAFSGYNILLLVAGCLVGTFIGLIPGLGPMTAIALMIPVAASLDPAAGIIVMAAVYYGAIFGGSTSAILINAPGVASTVATSFDGYPMAQQGQPGKALSIAALASFAGGIIGAVLLLAAGPSLATLSLSFQSSDYFALMVLAMVCVCAFSGSGNFLKAALMTVVGVMLSTVGADDTQGVPRFTLGQIDLIDGISFLLLVMATFALSEALLSTMRNRPGAAKPNVTSLAISAQEAKQAAAPVARSSLLGFVIGLLPGAGATIASLLAYGTEQRVASPAERAKFGSGSIKGLAAQKQPTMRQQPVHLYPCCALVFQGLGPRRSFWGR